MSPSNRGLIITSCGGYCPCQAYGTFDGLPFYFRARHGTWTLDVVKEGEDPILPDHSVVIYQASGDDPDAGFMNDTVARMIIVSHYLIYRFREYGEDPYLDAGDGYPWTAYTV